MKQVTLNVSEEFVAAGDAIATIIADIKLKKSAGEIAADALPHLIAAVSGYADFQEDIKLVDNQVYLLKSILGSLEGK